jgi:hypothetical protein
VQTRQQQQQGVNFIGPSGTVVYTNSSSFGAPNCVETDRQTDRHRDNGQTDRHRQRVIQFPGACMVGCGDGRRV